MRSINRAVRTVLAATAGLAASHAAMSSTSIEGAGLEEIIVTATKRSERLQDVPVAITALTGVELERRGAVRLEDYVAAVPGLAFASNGGNSGVLAIRGVATGTLAGNTQSPVALYYDDVPALESFAPLGMPDLQLFDVDQVEVLRGPQGTLFGSGSLGGAIRVQTAKPDLGKFGGKAEFSGNTIDGGGNGFGVAAAVNLPLIEDELGVRLVGTYRRDGGYVDNSRLGATDVNEGESYGFRGRLRWKPTERLTVDALINSQNDEPEDGAYVAYAGKEFVGDSYVKQPVAIDNSNYQLAVEYELDVATLTSLSSYADRITVLTRDFTPPIIGALSPLGVTGVAPVDSRGPSRSFSQELRLASRGDGALKWLAGAYYLDSHRESHERILVPGAGAVLAPFGFPSDLLFVSDSDIDTTEKALFGEVSYEFVQDWTLTVGARTIRNDVKFDTVSDGIVNGGPSRVQRDTSEKATTPKVALAWRVSPQVNLYARAAKGYRIGQNNLTPATDPTSGLPIPANYSSDSLWNYELGAKTLFLEGRLSMDGALYDIEWDDIQLQASSATGFNYIDNVGKARSRGAEFQVRALPAPNLELGLAVTYTNAEITEVAPNVNARVGDQLPGTPEWMVSDYISWTFAPSLAAFLRLEHQYFGEAYSDLNNPTALTFGDYNRFNLRTGITLSRFDLMLSVDNLTNTYAYVSAVQLPIGPTAVPLRPRTIGLTVRTSF
jgi:outer membrane receptor protein involved in Fe transport